VTFNSRGTALAAADLDGEVKVWDLTTRRGSASTMRFSAWRQPPMDEVPALAFSPDDNTLATGEIDGRLQLWDVITGQERVTLPGEGRPIRGLKITSDGMGLLYATNDGVLHFWDVSPCKKCRFVLKAFGGMRAIQ